MLRNLSILTFYKCFWKEKKSGPQSYKDVIIWQGIKAYFGSSVTNALRKISLCIFYENNCVVKKSYYIFGKKINKEEFDLESNRIKILNNL